MRCIVCLRETERINRVTCSRKECARVYYRVYNRVQNLREFRKRKANKG